MAYNVTLNKRAIKALEKFNEPYYTNIKEAIYSLGDSPRPEGYKKLIFNRIQAIPFEMRCF